MHLAAGGNGRDPALPALDLGEDAPDGRRDARPPILGPLLGPAEGRHDLVVLARDDAEDAARPVDQGGAHAARTDIDRQREIAAGHGCQTFSRPVPYWSSIAITMMTPM